MRRINPFANGARDNFPDLSPFKPPKLAPQITKELSYGPSDSESSSFDDDEDKAMQLYGDDFDDDDGDVVIDAEGSGSDIDDVQKEKGAKDDKVKKNIDLDWSIDTLATIKPAEVSLFTGKCQGGKRIV